MVERGWTRSRHKHSCHQVTVGLPITVRTRRQLPYPVGQSSDGPSGPLQHHPEGGCSVEYDDAVLLVLSRQEGQRMQSKSSCQRKYQTHMLGT